MSVKSVSCPQIFSSWANLPPDILLSIVDSLDATTTIRLSVVCVSWASTIRPGLPSFPPFRCNQSVPWLLCSAHKSDTNPNRSDLTFYDFSTTAYYSVRIPAPFFCNHQWLGSYKGWVVTLDSQLLLHLIKPLTGAHVLLPSNGMEELPKKVILCPCPNNTNKLQAFCLTHEGGLFSMKLGDDSWTWMDRYYLDIAVYQGKLYAVSYNIVSYWNLQSHSIKSMAIRSEYPCWECSLYLLEWNSELVMLMIDEKTRIRLQNQTPKQVKLFKFKFGINYTCSLSLVESLGNDALILGAICSNIISSSSHDDVQPNHIHFIDRVSCCFHDAETSHLNHNLGKQTYKPCCQRDSPMHMTSPIWFWPC